MRRIASRQNPIVSRYRLAARGQAADVVLLDGVHLVADAMAAGVHVREVAITADGAEDRTLGPILEQLDRAGADTFVVTAPVMAALSPVRSSSPIVALAERPVRYDRVFAAPAPLIVIMLGVQDPGNVGAIIRVAEAAGATGVIAAGGSADPYGWKALRGSMGSALRLPIIIAKHDWSLAEVRHRGCRIVATTPRGGRLLTDTCFEGPMAILIGGEGAGLPAPLLKEADDRVSIPMEAPVESLNAAVTAALLLYEARRQRTH